MGCEKWLDLGSRILSWFDSLWISFTRSRGDAEGEGRGIDHWLLVIDRRCLSIANDPVEVAVVRGSQAAVARKGRREWQLFLAGEHPVITSWVVRVALHPDAAGTRTGGQTLRMCDHLPSDSMSPARGASCQLATECFLRSRPPRTTTEAGSFGQCVCKWIESARCKSSSKLGLNFVSERHCVAVRRGGEQRKENVQSVG